MRVSSTSEWRQQSQLLDERNRLQGLQRNHESQQTEGSCLELAAFEYVEIEFQPGDEHQEGHAKTTQLGDETLEFEQPSGDS